MLFINFFLTLKQLKKLPQTHKKISFKMQNCWFINLGVRNANSFNFQSLTSFFQQQKQIGQKCECESVCMFCVVLHFSQYCTIIKVLISLYLTNKLLMGFQLTMEGNIKFYSVSFSTVSVKQFARRFIQCYQLYIYVVQLSFQKLVLSLLYLNRQ